MRSNNEDEFFFSDCTEFLADLKDTLSPTTELPVASGETVALQCVAYWGFAIRRGDRVLTCDDGERK